MATKTATPTEVTPTNITKLAQLRAEKRVLDEQIKAAKADEKVDRLPAVQERQATAPNKALVVTLQAALRQRLAAGQPRDEAIAGVLENCRAFLVATPAPEPKQPKAAKNAAEDEN